MLGSLSDNLCFVVDKLSRFSGQRWELKNLRLLALGEHQQDNALTAISTALSLRSQGTRAPAVFKVNINSRLYIAGLLPMKL